MSLDSGEIYFVTALEMTCMQESLTSDISTLILDVQKISLEGIALLSDKSDTRSNNLLGLP
jgi:hypothetical protein